MGIQAIEAGTKLAIDNRMTLGITIVEDDAIRLVHVAGRLSQDEVPELEHCMTVRPTAD